MDLHLYCKLPHPLSVPPSKDAFAGAGAMPSLWEIFILASEVACVKTGLLRNSSLVEP